MRRRLLIILGPTAVGKTDYSIEMALNYGSPVISCDSRQIYKEMSIGTAVPSQDQLSAVQLEAVFDHIGGSVGEHITVEHIVRNIISAVNGTGILPLILAVDCNAAVFEDLNGLYHVQFTGIQTSPCTDEHFRCGSGL